MAYTSIGKSLAWMGGASFLGQIITWSVTIIVARLLAPEDYGLVAISGLFTVFAHMVCLMGISAAVIQADEVSEYQLSALYGLSILAGATMLGLGLVAAAPLMAYLFDDERLVALVGFQSLVFVFGAPKSLQWSVLARNTRFDVIAKVETISRVLTSLCVLAMAALGFGVWTLASQWILIELYQLIGFSFYRRITPTFLIRWEEIKDFVIFGIKILARNSIGQLYASVDIIIIGKLASAPFLGGYSFAKHLANIPFEKIITIINRVLLPYLSKDKENPQSMREWTFKVADYQAVFVAPFFYLLFFTAEEAVSIVLGPNWGAAVVPLKIFCLANVVKLIESYSMVALTALGLVSEQIRYVVLQLIVIGGAMLGLAWFFNVEISIYTWVLVYPILCIILTRLLFNTIGITFIEVILYLKNILISHFILLGVLTAVDIFYDGENWETLLIKIGIGVLVYALSIFFLEKEKIFRQINLMKNTRSSDRT